MKGVLLEQRHRNPASRQEEVSPCFSATLDSLGKILMLGKIEGGRRRGRQRMRWLDGITDAMDMV